MTQSNHDHKPAFFWALSGVFDGEPALYTGTAKGRTWRECRRRGDRAVKVKVMVIP